MKVLEIGSGEKWDLVVDCKRITDSYGFQFDPEIERCCSSLKIDKNDVRYQKWFKYPNIEGENFYVTCPICHSRIELEASKLPEWVQKKAKDRYKEEKDIKDVTSCQPPLT